MIFFVRLLKTSYFGYLHSIFKENISQLNVFLNVVKVT